MEKPVNLQINNSGAWRHLIKFDDADTERTNAIQHHAMALAGFAGARLRVHTADAMPVVLRYWTADKGWHEPNRLGDQS